MRKAIPPEARSGPLVVETIIAVACAIMFLVLAHLVVDGATDRIDIDTVRWLAAHRGPGLTVFFLNITYLGTKITLFTMAIGICIGLLLVRRPGMATAMATSMIGGSVISGTFKVIVARPRPPGELMLVPETDYAFPSGHTIHSVVFFVTIALLIASHVERRSLRAFLIVYALFVGFLVAISRVYLGVHYPTDVAGGILVAVAWSLAVVVTENVWRHRSHRP